MTAMSLELRNNSGSLAQGSAVPDLEVRFQNNLPSLYMLARE
jgi:hypothetical protein